MHDVPVFDRFAPVYDLFMPSADAADFEPGLARATGSVDRVLDVGGGTGRIARALAASPDTTVSDPIVLDAARGMLEQARKHGLQTLQADVRSWPVRDDAVDAVVAADAIHHFPDLDGFVSEASRAIRPGGVVVVRDFDPTTIRGRALVAAEHLFFDSTFYTPDELAGRLSAGGFEAHVLDRGFGYTVAGRRLESGSGER